MTEAPFPSLDPEQPQQGSSGDEGGQPGAEFIDVAAERLSQVYVHLDGLTKPTAAANMAQLFQLLRNIDNCLANLNVTTEELADVRVSAQRTTAVARRDTLTFEYAANEWARLAPGLRGSLKDSTNDYSALLETQDNLKGSIGTLAKSLQTLAELVRLITNNETHSSPRQVPQPTEIRKKREHHRPQRLPRQAM